MAIQTSQGITNFYYFDPLTQQYSKEYQNNRIHISIELTTPKELPSDKLSEVLKKLGNFTALNLVKQGSRNTEANYCNDFTAHALTCKQVKWSFCERHLTPQEIEECSDMEKRLSPVLLKGISYRVQGSPVPNGEIDLMRRILGCVRAAINQQDQTEGKSTA